MKTSGRPRSTRDRPAKAPLSEEAIVDAAVAILKAEGLEAVSMRRVAAALDTGAGSLYVYVAGRDGLLEAMFDRIIAAVKLETPDPSRWRAQLHSLLERLRAELVTHPEWPQRPWSTRHGPKWLCGCWRTSWESCLLAASTLRTPRGPPTSSRPR